MMKPAISKTSRSGRVLRCAAPVLASLSLAACSGEGADIGDPSGRSQDIIGGFHADSSALDHFGALVAIDPTTNEPFEFCSSTLIGPETVVTAKHCAAVLPDAQFSGFGLAWAPGPDVQEATDLIPLAAVETAPGDVGGFVAMGRDVALIHLDHATSIPPATPAPFTDALIGTAMVSVGYGVYGASGSSDDHRRIGRETVAGTEGRVFEIMFGGFENFVEWAFTGQVTDDDFLATLPPDDPNIPFLRDQFDRLLLFNQHEAVTGLEPSDTQSCFGDSGGPLARFTREGGWRTYGVVSGGLSSLRSVCDFGTVFSTFGPETFAFIQDSLDWVDPCGDVTAAGSCDGSVAVTCETSFIGNIRRLNQVDCAERGLACVSSELGTGCGEVSPPEPSDPPEPGAEEEVLDAVRKAFLPEVARDLHWD
ncbi:MAG TPA: trypsin-like serine protease [Polyangiaceae bacterium]|nr:trypsin-like serine protease [Polyangiaceae bacterium]